MCQSNVYTIEEDREELLLEDVASLEVDGDRVTMKTLFGEPVSLRAHIVEIDLMRHKVLLAKEEKTHA